MTNPHFKSSDFLAWVKEQKPNVVFNFDSVETCAMAQYLKSIVGKNVFIEVYTNTYEIDRKVFAIPSDLKKAYIELNDRTLVKFSYGNHPMTFGDFAKELEAVMHKE